ncbi:hypothetical protein Ahy_A03g011161 [Arachis hypogaea]|uniref:CCHC-type domain-containing protein n=1 Tax=Arachis hypogaea TaxID=3818 RepID=A0A445DPU4_ARAHY|nr:hypothetical protein Ahy_A03g011161 [Arachis hypogaea]
MSIFAEKKEKAEKYKGSILSKSKKKLDIITTKAIEWQTRWTAETCSCRFWSLTLEWYVIPHACSAIFKKGDNPKEYCNNYYSPAAYHATNRKPIAPINEKNMVKPGRPRMVRIRKPDKNRYQTKYRRTSISVTCNNCDQYGHKRRHCPNPIMTDTFNFCCFIIDDCHYCFIKYFLVLVDITLAFEPTITAAASDATNGSPATGSSATKESSGARFGAPATGVTTREKDRKKVLVDIASAPEPTTTVARSSTTNDSIAVGINIATLTILNFRPAQPATSHAHPHTPATQLTSSIGPLTQSTLPITSERRENTKDGIKKATTKSIEHIDLTND